MEKILNLTGNSTPLH